MSREKITMKSLHLFAKSKRGRCLSDAYFNSHSKYLWECSLGHKWEARFSKIKGVKNKSGTWCPACSAKKNGRSYKVDLSILQQLAKQKKGECLSIKYINAKSKYEWVCEEEHFWSASYDQIRKGSWCPVCANKNRGAYHKKDILQLQELANKRGGKCLTTQYKDVFTKYEWKCSRDHVWKASANSVLRGSWCPKCNYFISEEIVRLYIQKYLKAEFPKVRPSWLRTKSSGLLELDGYNSKLKIAFEHQGHHHYEPTYYKQSGNLLSRIKYRDKIKRERCSQAGIKLIVVPELFTRLKLNELGPFLERKFQLLNIPYHQIKITDEEINKLHHRDYLSELKLLALKMGGECLSKTYLTARTNYQWKCKNNHVWEAPAYGVKSGTWCGKCAGNSYGSLDDLFQIAEKMGGKCLSKNYRGRLKKYKFECNEKHIFQSTGKQIVRGSWCPKCAEKRKGSTQRGNIDQLHQVAKERGGRCLSKTYINSPTKYSWECGKGHQWKATASSVKSGKWCRICSGASKCTIANLQEVAGEKNGKCLSKRYTNTHAKYLWECKEKHQWQATAVRIKSGTWCPICCRKRTKI
jgi:thiol-disulfide isomerase/thioredoxin